MTAPLRELPPGFRLFRGDHPPPVDGQPIEVCFDEAVSWIAGEPHSAAPQCMCTVLARHGMRLNDRLDDDERQLLVPLIYRCVGTRSGIKVMRRRSFVLVDAAVREIVPIGLEAVGWRDLAEDLRGIVPIVDNASARAAQSLAAKVLDEAWRRRRRRTTAAADATTYAAATAADAAAAAYDAAYAAAYAADAAAAAYDAADAAAYAATADDAADRVSSQARRPIVLASIAAFERAIGTK